VIESLPDPDHFNSCQIQNAAGVLMVLQHLATRFPVATETIRAGLAEFRLNGRFQVLPGELQFVLDVAHNQQAATVLLQNLRGVPAAGRTHIIIGMLRDKDRLSVFRILDEVASSWHTVSLCNSRGTDAETLAAELRSLDSQKPVHAHADVGNALAAVRASATTGDRVLITGSFLTVGAALKILESKG
jgi:dihydrofolate synthase / folylpolyglutamate synthase